MADFCLVSKRTLNEWEHRLFRYHFLLGADWRLCSRKMDIDRGKFFHEIYRIEQKLGRTFRELQPHALFPVDEYFSSTYREMRPANLFDVETDEEAELPRASKLLRFPVRRAA